MARSIRVGIIGCGKIAEVSHLPDFKAVPGVEIVALCDLVPAKMESLRDKFAPGAALFADYKKLLTCGVDAVSVCTPNFLHCTMTLAALKRGLHVLCEKPMAGTIADANRMVAAAKKAGKVLQIDQSFRYSSHHAEVVRLVAEGAIGKPLHARCIRAHGCTPDVGWSPGAKWFVQKKAQGGLILDIGIHMADLLKWIMGDVSEVAALIDTRTRGIDVPDNVMTLLRFENGSTGVLELSWTMPSGAGGLEIYGSAGRIRMGYSAEHPIELISTSGGKHETLYPQPPAGMKNCFERFAMAIRREAPSPTPGELGREALALCVAIAESGEKGKFVKVKKFPRAKRR